jgi:DNA mismatch endonuclease (patch repair protein)
MEKILRQYLPGGSFSGVSERASRNFGAVRSRNNKTTELRLRLALVRAGIRGWKLHTESLPGTPDFVFPQGHLVVFVDGCFWHGCRKCGHIPRTNTDFWRAKIRRNSQRDRANSATLRAKGMTVLRFWEHELRDNLSGCLKRISVGLSLAAPLRPNRGRKSASF